MRSVFREKASTAMPREPRMSSPDRQAFATALAGVSPVYSIRHDQAWPLTSEPGATSPLRSQSASRSETRSSFPQPRNVGRQGRFTEELRSPRPRFPEDYDPVPQYTSAQPSPRVVTPPVEAAQPRGRRQSATTRLPSQQEFNHVHRVPGSASQYNGEGSEVNSIAQGKYGEQQECYSKQDVRIKRWSWLFVTLMVLSVYSTVLSGLWLIVSILQPGYGRSISSSSMPGVIHPATASLVAALLAKTTELSFVTVFVAFLGQVLTRRSIVQKSKGMTIAEMSLRNWVIQPGSLFTHWEGIPYAAGTFLGVLTLLATVCSIFYTTASDALVNPKLKFSEWQGQNLQGLVKTSYANPYFASGSCATPIGLNIDETNAGASCLDVQYSGQSYRNLLDFLGTWKTAGSSNQPSLGELRQRPVGTSVLSENTTLYSSWIETEFGDVAKNHATYGRIVNNVTMAMPHPGVSAAATNKSNNILQPSDLSGVGEYNIRASVVSPSVNVMCVNMDRSELVPLVYTEFPHAQNEIVDGLKKGNDGWTNDVTLKGADDFLNSTAVDDVFRWGRKYQRRAPFFQYYPPDHNIITNFSVIGSDGIYILAKSALMSNYTLCELRSWVTPKCSTQFNISGIAGSQMKAHCEDANDLQAYSHMVGGDVPSVPSIDWKNLSEQWRLSMGIAGANASSARILNNLALTSPMLSTSLPSMAEGLAVLSSSTLIIGSVQSTYRHYWDESYNGTSLDPGVSETFKAMLRTQQYTSAKSADWHAIFYVVLGLVFVMNLICLLYILLRAGLVTDYTEPQNAFALAINSRPSAQLRGSCGGGPESRDLVVPFRVEYVEATNHYMFAEANERPWRGRYSKQSSASGTELLPESGYQLRYKRTNSSQSWT